MKKYTVTLADEEIEQLQAFSSKGKHAAKKVINALILLNCDESQGAERRRSQREIAQVLQVSERKIERVKQRFVEDALEMALNGQTPQREYEHKVDGDLEAQLIALSCSGPPSGHARWRLSGRFRIRRCGACSKKRTQALEEGGLGDRARGQRRVRRQHGAGA